MPLPVGVGMSLLEECFTVDMGFVCAHAMPSVAHSFPLLPMDQDVQLAASIA